MVTKFPIDGDESSKAEARRQRIKRILDFERSNPIDGKQRPDVPSPLKPPNPYWFPSPSNNFIKINQPICVDNMSKYLAVEIPDSVISDMQLDPSKDLDVVSFLSNHGKTRHLIRYGPSQGSKPYSIQSYDINQAIKGKYVAIACFWIPILTQDDEAHKARAMIASYFELTSKYNFELVAVVNMKKFIGQSQLDEADLLKVEYDKFVGKFPCFFIPYEDIETRAYVSSQIGFHGSSSCILVNPFGKILDYESTAAKFLSYGSEWYPFDDSTLRDINFQDYLLKFRLDPFYRLDPEGDVPDGVLRDPLLGEPLSLARDILLCEPSLKLERVGPDGGSICVAELLSNKHVGLYLCIDGHFMSTLNTAHQQCIENNNQLEIVLVCLPLFQDEEKYHHDLRAALKHYGITSWLRFPFNHKVSRRLWRVLGMEWIEDRFIVLSPNSVTGELLGKAVIKKFGVGQYPFTRISVRERRLAALMSLTPVSLFGSTITGGICGTKPVIQDKRLLIYLDRLRYMRNNRELFRLLKGHYQESQRQGCEVVFVPLNAFIGAKDFKKMPWPYVPSYAAVKNSVASQLILKDDDDSPRIMAFEKDGKLVSRNVEKGLKEHGFGEHLFKEDTKLYDEMYDEITTHLAFLQWHRF